MSATIARIRRVTRVDKLVSSKLVIEIRRHALVRYSPEAMFDLVNDVEAYPTRFAWCAAAEDRRARER